ncbi:metallophosphoesterase [Pelosinus fermentans]|uniref:metallophosphoesterase n=1 Tax=Pelosinus fermentans TaxID=365349 RepID=UPI0002689BA1
MRVFTISDIHVDFAENLYWLNNLSCNDYLNDILILAGDITDTLPLFEKTLRKLRKRFSEVLFIPGNQIYGCEVVILKIHWKNCN